MRRGCDAARADLGLTAGCCTSCHEDADHGYDLIELSPEMGDKVEHRYDVCCDVYNALERQTSARS